MSALDPSRGLLLRAGNATAPFTAVEERREIASRRATERGRSIWGVVGLAEADVSENVSEAVGPVSEVSSF
jgi:hypothetical protein